MCQPYRKKNTENKDYFSEKNERLLRDMKSLRLVSRKKKENADNDQIPPLFNADNAETTENAD